MRSSRTGELWEPVVRAALGICEQPMHAAMYGGAWQGQGEGMHAGMSFEDRSPFTGLCVLHVEMSLSWPYRGQELRCHRCDACIRQNRAGRE